jgi:hypothetical protein
VDSLLGTPDDPVVAASFELGDSHFTAERVFKDPEEADSLAAKDIVRILSAGLV